MRMRRFRKKVARAFVSLCLIGTVFYGIGRLYFNVTGGFTLGNILSDFSWDQRWETRPLQSEEKEQIDQILSQNFYYLGKGCQSYVFISEDQEYVIKFFKYQRFRPQAWMTYLNFFPPVEKLRQSKIEKKRAKLENVYSSWKIAFDELQEETGLVYVHLNKTDYLQKTLTIYDKMGMQHRLNCDEMEFLIQSRADMLCDTLDELMERGESDEAKGLLTHLMRMVVSEYERGLADNDHALMQNTGVHHGRPVHVDVGQFVYNEEMKNREISDQELYNKTYKFRIWLQQTHPELLTHVNQELQNILGERFHELNHIPKVKG